MAVVRMVSGAELVVAQQLAGGFPTILQLVDDLADTICLPDAESFKHLAAEVLHAVHNPCVDVMSYTIPDTVVDKHRTSLESYQDALNALVEVHGTSVSLSRAGRKLVRHSKFRPVTEVEERTVKVCDADIRSAKYQFTDMCDLVIVDPPYGLGVAEWDREAWTEDDFYDMFEALKEADHMKMTTALLRLRIYQQPATLSLSGCCQALRGLEH